MKKITKIGFLLCASVLTFSGCSDNFLDEPVPTEAVAESVVFGSRIGVEAFISGIQRRARAQFERTDAGGVNSLYFARTIKGNDLIHANSWWSFDYANDNREPTYTRTIFSWEFPYYVINQTNTLINGIEVSGLSEIDKVELSAQGKALRAFYYFQLAQEFQLTYAKDPDAVAPPIYTELSLTGNPMSTLREMYKLIVDDLTFAVENLGTDRLGKSYVNVDVANGLLARVYLVMENWSGAEVAARNAYGGDVNASLAPSAYKDGFSDISNPEWIWGLPQTADQSNYYYNAPSAFVDPINPAYNNIYVNKFFSDTFTETDVRNTFRQNPSGVTDFRQIQSTKFVFAFDSDIVLMRTPEMILMEAEAKFRQGDEPGARTLLYALQLNRDTAAVASNNGGSALEEEILLERRKEMYGEFGVEWFDARRLQRGITRTANHRIVLTLEPNDKRFYLKVPQKEIDANDNIDDSVNANR
ncbi:RagB/SusD family nutrient uptake outer membrane protein [Gelidibacter salicanalis]|uniref:RagB/SusD family nutrient uptake outer membrane protein n=1 Tax=Gelidibacter salicanalis TaxID=291193 RepID=A0A934NIL4_9FLAO|nr:RagB/SusD family nutrient uptake outer membrane protein [Gelidibacter salicanalis]MBJ7880214.1 RagB/SusD family nutrient uptake outer membrane protein [Gelidibacter salicanalis]